MRIALFIMFLLVVISWSAFGQTPDNYVPVEYSTSNLSGDAAFTSKKYDVRKYKYIVLNVTADQNSASNGVQIQQACASDCITATSPTYQVVSDWTYTAASTSNSYIADVVCACARVVYTNGSTPQGANFIRVGLIRE